MDCVADAELAVYLVTSNIIHKNGCDLWVSPFGGREQMESVYKTEKQPYEVVRISGLTDEAIRALTERERDTNSPGAEEFFSLVADVTQESYRLGLKGDSPSHFAQAWPGGDRILAEAIDTCVAAAYKLGQERRPAML